MFFEYRVVPSLEVVGSLKQQCLEEMKEWMNDLGIREIRKEEIDIDYRRKCEDKIYELKDKFNGLSMKFGKSFIEAKGNSFFDEISFLGLRKQHNSENVDTIIESLSYSPIPVEDSDSLMEEIDLFLTSDDSMPPGIESDDYDSEGDFRFLKELLINDSSPLPENESYNLDSFDNPESPVVKSCFDFEPVAAVANDFDVLNNDESFDSGEGENVDSLNVEEEDSPFTLIFDFIS
ncbi:hypothetical protein Tco_1406879 [Tanacetum coccineum]